VPESARTEELDDIVEWLGELVRQVDSSLLEEWEKLTAGADIGEVVRPPLDEPARPVTGNARAFRVLVRNALFRRVELAARRDWATLGELDGEVGFDADAWREAMAAYFDEHQVLLTDADARGPDLLMVDSASMPQVWRVRQILHDPEEFHDWAITAEVDLAASDETGQVVVRVQDVASGGS
jgi:hypothetical protein